MKKRFYKVIVEYVSSHKRSLFELNRNFIEILKFSLMCKLNNEFYNDEIRIQNVLLIDSENYSKSILDEYDDHIFIIRSENAQDIRIEPSSNIANILG